MEFMRPEFSEGRRIIDTPEFNKLQGGVRSHVSDVGPTPPEPHEHHEPNACQSNQTPASTPLAKPPTLK
jgi:hypothetical protein